MSIYIKRLRGVYGSYIIYCYNSARRIYICLKMTRYHPCGTHYWDKAFSLNACAVDQFYFSKLVWTREIFPVKQIAHVAIPKCTLGWKRETLKRKTKWKQNCFAVTFPRGKVKYHFSYLCKHKYKIFICCRHEIDLQGNLAEESFYLIARKGI